MVLGMVALGLSACTKLDYSIEVANYGRYGVILKDAPLVEDGEALKERGYVNPGIPGVAANFYRVDHFTAHPNSLPKRVTITWQLAELTNCEIVERYKVKITEDAKRKWYTRKRGCDWQPIEGKEYSKDIDMEAIRESEAYEKAGTWVEGMPFRDYYLVITLVFRDGRLVVESSNSYRTGV